MVRAHGCMLIENGREPSLLEWGFEVSVSEGRIEEKWILESKYVNSVVYH